MKWLESFSIWQTIQNSIFHVIDQFVCSFGVMENFRQIFYSRKKIVIKQWKIL